MAKVQRIKRSKRRPSQSGTKQERSAMAAEEQQAGLAERRAGKVDVEPERGATPSGSSRESCAVG
jgi:hypothetical protein